MSGQKKRSFLSEAFKHRVVFDQECAEKTWKILEHEIHEIYNHNLSSFSFEEMYRHAYNMVVHNFGEKLYSGLVTTMTYHVKEMSKSIEAAQGELFLEELNRNWAEHNKAVQMVRDILVYMDRTFIPSTHKTPVCELGLNLWRDVVIDASKTRSRLLDTLLELVHRERSGEVINRGLLRNIIKMLMDLGSTVYQDDFEKHFLEVSADFYRCESREFMESCDCGNYLKKAERRLTEEMERVSHYLDARSKAKITNVVRKEMIESHMNRLVHMESSGLVNMLVDDKYNDLRRMYRLFRRVQNGLVIVQDVMTAYIRDTGMQLVTDPEMLRDPVDFVQRLLDLKDKYDKVISLAFNNDKTFQNALNSSFEYFINLNARCPEFICLFVDDKLRKGLRGLSEEDVGVILDKVMMLVCYLQENDKKMIGGHMNRLVHMESSSLVNMLVDDKYDDLGRMCRLFHGVQNGLVIVQDVMTAYIRDTGMQLVTDPEMLRDPVDFVQRLLYLKDKYDKVISLAFNNDKTFQNALNSSFEYVINLNARSPEFICLFVDDKLRKGLRGDSEEDVEVVLDKVMMLFRYLQENDKEMIEGHMNRLVHMESSGLVNMLVDDKYDDLGRMYSLFSKVQNGLVIVRDVMTAYIRDTGKQLVTDPERLRDPVDFVQRLLDLKDKYYKVISLAFNNDKTFQNALNSSFEYFINLNARSPEFISLFVDNKLRKGPRGVSEEDVEVVLDKVMMLVHYLQEKDVFEKYYKQHLAKRLLSGKTVSDDAERSLIVKLKTECGYQFTCKLEGMFTDMKISQDTMHGFYSTVGPLLGDSPMLTVQVLTTGSWPTQPSATCNLPAEILWVCEKFKSYYLGIHTGRRLSWQTNMGTADLKSTFGKGQKHELNVSTYQMCVLMLFNNADRLTYKEIEQATQIPAIDLKRCLQSLACVKGKNILRKEPMSKDIAEDDAFFFNDKFTSKFFNIKIGTVVAQRETEPENVETRQRVEEDRKPQIEAAIVRIMKSRRVLDHNNIVAEVTKQLQGRFLPNPVVIKRRIESLIEREFLERDKTDGKLYRYLA